MPLFFGQDRLAIHAKPLDGRDRRAYPLVAVKTGEALLLLAEDQRRGVPGGIKDPKADSGLLRLPLLIARDDAKRKRDDSPFSRRDIPNAGFPSLLVSNDDI